MTSYDYYETLGVRQDAIRDEIRQAYHRLCELHEGNPHELRKVKEAWRVLGSPNRREAYDNATRAARLHSKEPEMRRPAKTDVPDESVSGLRRPAKTDVPEDQPPGLRQAVPTDVVEPSGLQPPKPTDISEPQREVAPASQVRAPTHAPVTTLLIQRRGEEPWSLGLEAGLHRIGRGGKGACDILLPDPVDKFISREHATLRVEEKGCSIRDEYSVNGTRVEGARIPPGQWVRVEDGCAIRIEDYVLIPNRR